MLPEPTLPQLRAAAIAGATIAILATSFRLYLRIRRRNLWWDDAWAFMSMLAIIVMLTGMMIFTSPPDAHPYGTKIAGYYMFDNGFYGVIWCARVSIFCTIIRMAYGRLRVFLKWCVASVLFTWAILFAQVFWTCEAETTWKSEPTPQCQLGRDVAIAQLITDCLVDLLLIICPIMLLSNMKNRKSLKIRLIAIFSSTIATTIFSIVHSYMILEGLGKMEFMFAVIEDVVSLLVVNLTVIASWFFKLSEEGEESSGPSAHMNTFLKGRLSGRGSRSTGTRDATHTIGLATLGTHTRIEAVDSQRVLDKADGTVTILPPMSDNENRSVEKFAY
ncbi:hypothetical protein VNI00_017689 [Paramarasmius palmivorus]|uniref:Rhodopsin domain-containing protein n=1 Tax=Paramarasmius palmivorus TaxID=297713 RepID=A0AAW0B3T4_9AGAR